MATTADIEAFKSICATGGSMNIERLVRRSEEWGSITFESARASLETAQYLFGAFATMPIHILPDGELSTLVGAGRAVSNRVETIEKFRIDSGESPRQAADAITAQLRNETDQFLRQSAPILPLLAYYRGDIQEQLSKIEASVASAVKLYEDGKAVVDEKTKQIDDALTAARNTAANAGAAVFTQDFLSEAQTVEKVAFHWLLAAMTLGGASLLVAVIVFLAFQPPPTASVPFIVQQTITKLLIVGGLITGALWCGSMFRALKHQAAINRHRGNSLKTFQAFIEAAGDSPDVRNAVLLETTRSIFAIAPTGFLNATETNVDGGPKIAEVLKAFGKAS